jgi:hypothetical protein
MATTILTLRNGTLVATSRERGTVVVTSVAQVHAIEATDDVFCSSDLDFPEECTSDADVIALCHAITGTVPESQKLGKTDGLCELDFTTEAARDAQAAQMDAKGTVAYTFRANPGAKFPFTLVVF